MLVNWRYAMQKHLTEECIQECGKRQNVMPIHFQLHPHIAWQNIAWLTKLTLILCHASNWKLQKQQTSVDCINKNNGYIILQYNRHRYTCTMRVLLPILILQNKAPKLRMIHFCMKWQTWFHKIRLSRVISAFFTIGIYRKWIIISCYLHCIFI